jgi:transposase-like protein
MANKQDVLNEILAGAEKKALTGRMQNAEVNHHPATEAADRGRDCANRRSGNLEKPGLADAAKLGIAVPRGRAGNLFSPGI